MSRDGALGFVVIAMVGNPFSPWYYRARERGDAPATRFSAMNVCVYGPRARTWALTERAIDASARRRDHVRIGASAMYTDRDAIVVELEERASPDGQPVRGRIRFEPEAMSGSRVDLDAEAHHTWWPVAPRGRVRVQLDEPGVSFDGVGYHDANAGRVPLEASFSRWSWARGALRDGRSLVTYDVVDRRGARGDRAWLVQRDGALEAASLPTVALPPSPWFRVAREARSESAARVARTLEDTPFYARSLVASRAFGEPVELVHEALSLDRFRTRWVRALLGYRMARVS